MNFGEMITAFNLRFDIYGSGGFTTTEVTSFLNEAQRNIVEREYKQYCENKRSSSEFQKLIITTAFVTPTNAEYHTLPSDYKYLVSVQLRYTHNGRSITNVAELLPFGDVNNSYSTGSSVFVPAYRLESNATAPNNRLYYLPITASAISISYIKEPTTITNSTPTIVPDIPPKLQDDVVAEAVILAKRSLYAYETVQIDNQLNIQNK